MFFLGILLHIPCIFPLQGLLEYIHGLLQEYVRRSIPGVHIPKSPGIEHLRISWIFGSPVLKHPEVVPVAIPGMFSLSWNRNSPMHSIPIKDHPEIVHECISGSTGRALFQECSCTLMLMASYQTCFSHRQPWWIHRVCPNMPKWQKFKLGYLYGSKSKCKSVAFFRSTMKTLHWEHKTTR